MADKENDKPENKGLGRVKATLFKENSDGQSLAGEAGKGLKRGLLMNIGTEYRPIYATPIVLGSMVFATAITCLPMHGELLTSEDPAAVDTTLSYGFSENAGYQAVRLQDEDVVLVKDENQVWQVYLAQRDQQGDIELTFVENRHEAYSYVRSVVDAMQAQVSAYENYRRVTSTDGELMRYESVTKGYDYDDDFRRGAVNGQMVEADNMRDMFQQAVTSWQQAAQQIDAGGYGFREDSTPVQRMDERPQINGFGLAGDMLKIFGVPLAGMMLLGGAIGATNSGRRQRRNTKRYG